MRLAAGLLIAVAFYSGSPALACSLQDSERNTAQQDRIVAQALVDAAASVEVAVPIRAEVISAETALTEAVGPVAANGIRPMTPEQWRQPFGARIYFQTIERLKGSGDSGFILYGRGLTPEGGTWPNGITGWTHTQDPTAFLPTFYVLQREIDVSDFDWVTTSCDRAPLTATEGRRYLVFRNKDGRLLRMAKVGDRTDPIAVESFHPLVKDPAADPWLEAVRSAAAAAAPPEN